LTCFFLFFTSPTGPTDNSEKERNKKGQIEIVFKNRAQKTNKQKMERKKKKEKTDRVAP
jgi:hypothetical protein